MSSSIQISRKEKRELRFIWAVILGCCLFFQLQAVAEMCIRDRGERMVRSIANLTRQDGKEFLALAPKIGIRTEVETFPLSSANEALNQLRLGKIHGAAVLVMNL